MNGNLILYCTYMMMSFFQFHTSEEEATASKHTEVKYNVPEVFELMNVALSLTEIAQDDPYMLHQKSAYYQEVQSYFGKYKEHQLIQKLSQRLKKNPVDRYYNFRENSYLFCFEKDAIRKCKKMDYVFGSKRNNQTKKVRLLLEDFAKRSSFRQFYQAHLSYYDTLCEQTKQAASIEEMKNWLEQRFPNVSASAVELVLSPLIKNNHSTFNAKVERNYIIFLNPPHYDFSSEHALKDVYYTGSIFTEINNHYVAEVSTQYKKKIKKLKLEKWTTEGKPSSYYASSRSIFEEYLTHALFLLYLEETYESDISRTVQQDWIGFMKNRGFKNFDTYYEKLKLLYQTESTVIASIYPSLIDWLRQELAA